MRSAERRRQRLVAALLRGDAGMVRGDRVVATGSGGEVTIDLADAEDLVSAGVLRIERGVVHAVPEARSWLKRQMLESPEPYAAQHRTEATATGGIKLNLAESPLARLAVATRGEEPFLLPHQVEAGERVRRLAERARMQPRVTMSYSAAHVAGGKRGGQMADVSDMAAEARRQLSDIHRVLPGDCAGVVLDVCALLKGLQVVEQERGWPRRSAKLVLRIGLEQLAQHYGLSKQAVGADSRRRRVWLDNGARPSRFE